MKHILVLTLAVLLSGCCCTWQPCCQPTSQYTVVNNTGAMLAVYQDGKYLGELPTGGVMPVRGTLLWQRTVVTVVGHDAAGHYQGTGSWIYIYGTPEAWTVTQLETPR